LKTGVIIPLSVVGKLRASRIPPPDSGWRLRAGQFHTAPAAR